MMECDDGEIKFHRDYRQTPDCKERITPGRIAYSYGANEFASAEC